LDRKRTRCGSRVTFSGFLLRSGTLLLRPPGHPSATWAPPEPAGGLKPAVFEWPALAAHGSRGTGPQLRLERVSQACVTWRGVSCSADRALQVQFDGISGTCPSTKTGAGTA